MPGPLVGPAIGAGIGFLGSIFGGRPKVAGVDPLTNEAIANWRGITGYGNQGFAALGGDPEAVKRMMNPYSALMDPYWDELQEQGLGDIGARATQAGAFGGSRHGAVEGDFFAKLAAGKGAQRYGEFESAMGRAGQLASFGYGATGKLDEAGRYLRDVRQQQLAGKYRNPFGAAIGGAMIGSSLFPGSPPGVLPGAPDTSGFDPSSLPGILPWMGGQGVDPYEYGMNPNSPWGNY